MSWHKTLSAAHLKALDECYKKSADGYQVRWDGKVGIVSRSFQSPPNNNGDVVVPNPGGGTQLSWNTLNLPSFVGRFTGTPTSHNVRQYLSGTLAATATIEIVSVSGATGWSIVGNNLTHAGSTTGSGSFFLRAVFGAASADSAVIPWSYVVQTAAQYDWAPSDGLDNGTGAGNWVPFNGATLNSNPTSDGYLQISYANDWGGISSHHSSPAFVAGFEYEVTVNIDAGGSRDRIWVQLGLGPAVVFDGTGAITHNVVCGSGSTNMVLHANGEAATGLNTRIAAISVDPVANVFSLTSSALSVSVSAGTLQIGVARSGATNTSATVNIARTSGTDAVAQLAVSSLSWAANEGGTKFAALQLNGTGSVTLTISSPSVGALGAITSTVVTVTAVATGMLRPAVATWMSSARNDLGGFQQQYTSAEIVARFKRSHSAMINYAPEFWSDYGVSGQQIAEASKNASGSRLQHLFVYFDSESSYKPGVTNWYTAHQNAVATNNWKLYASGTSGTPLDSYWASTLYAYMMSNFATRDAQGRLPAEWWADYAAGFIHNGTQGSPAAPGLDGPCMDNVLSLPRISGDWNRDGSTDSPATAAQWWRQAIATAANRYKQQNPTKRIVGNIAEWPGHPLWGDIQGNAPEFYKLFHGGILEHLMAEVPHSPGEFIDTNSLVAIVQSISNALIDPNLLVVSGYPTSVGDLQAFRHALGFTLVITDGQLQWGENDWHEYFVNYPEYDFNLGLPTEAMKPAATQNGIWRRNYDNGIALWCPKNVTGTISLGGTFYVLRGSAAGFLTPGASVTSVTFSSGRNGLILSRTPT